MSIAAFAPLSSCQHRSEFTSELFGSSFDSPFWHPHGRCAALSVLMASRLLSFPRAFPFQQSRVSVFSLPVRNQELPADVSLGCLVTGIVHQPDRPGRGATGDPRTSLIPRGMPNFSPAVATDALMQRLPRWHVAAYSLEECSASPRALMAAVFVVPGQ